MNVNVMLKVSCYMGDEDIHVILRPYAATDVTIYDFSMYAGKYRVVACTLTVESLFDISREQASVLGCEANEEITFCGGASPHQEPTK